MRFSTYSAPSYFPTIMMIDVSDLIGHLRQYEITTGDSVDYLDAISRAFSCVVRKNEVSFEMHAWLDELLYEGEAPLTLEMSALLNTCIMLVSILENRFSQLGVYHNGALPYSLERMFKTSIALMRTDIYQCRLAEELNNVNAIADLDFTGLST
jgi:hypothetical protein